MQQIAQSGLAVVEIAVQVDQFIPADPGALHPLLQDVIRGSLASLTVGALLCRPSIAGKRVTEQADGRFRVELKTAGRDGTTAVFLSPANLTARMAALIPQPGKRTIRHWLGSAPLVQLGAFAPNARLRPLVVQAGALAPRRRGKLKAAGHDCQVALTAAELALHVVDLARRTSGRLAWSVAMRLA